MPKHFIIPIYTAIFFLILVATVPKKEIRRLAIYGIIFGAIFDVLAIIFGNVTNLYGYKDYGPFGFMGIPFFPPISWAIFFMLYFYFLPEQKLLIYIYITSAIGYSILFANLIMNLEVFELSHRYIPSIIAFSIWFPVATWGYLRFSQKNPKDIPDEKEEKLNKLKKTTIFMPYPHPAKKIKLKKPRKL